MQGASENNESHYSVEPKHILAIFSDVHLFSAGAYFHSMTIYLYGTLQRDIPDSQFSVTYKPLERF